ncbi:hypothetical protein [Pseudorhodobacter aquimaris]|uniref:hypothetical protein n=1 Tax=Pseudorhodobacter aquimaris TaxID=687412 RepID=UPI00067C8DE3|nr:hypothetical protein [Pseudorhodobacter aquimaris]
MIVVAPYAIHDAFAAWLLDAPPIARHHPAPIVFAAVRFGPEGTWPTLQANGGSHAIVGVSPSGWMCVANLRWRYFAGNTLDFLKIAAACNLAQAAALTENAWFETALRRHGQRSTPEKIGGLLVMKGSDGRQWVRPADIRRMDVKAAFRQHLTVKRDATMHLRYNVGKYRMDEIFADAEVWWRFARGWTEYPSSV